MSFSLPPVFSPPLLRCVIVGTNTTYLSNVVNDAFGVNFRTLVNRCRVAFAADVLSNGDVYVSMKEMHRRCGFLSRSAFYAAFTRSVGLSPLQYARESHRRPQRPVVEAFPGASK